MKFLTDENISPVIVRELRKLDHDVVDIKEQNIRGIEDTEITKMAQRENRIIITHDRAFAHIGLHQDVKLLLITFSHNEAQRSKMKTVGEFVAQRAANVFKLPKMHLNVDQDRIIISPLSL